MTTRTLFLTAWDPGLVVPFVCVLALASYTVVFWHRLQGRSIFFGLAVAVFFLALASPIGVLARGYLFCAHMLQHLLLLLAVPPLALLGLPRGSARLPSARSRGDGHTRGGAVGYLGPWAAGVGGMWIWHAPFLCDAAVSSPTVRTVQTVSLIAMGLAFWRPILAPHLADRLPPFAAVLYLFAACVACTVLGIMITFSPVEVCSAYMRPADSLGVLPFLRERWGLSCRSDQEIGGLLMWVPACLVYAAAILASLGRYYGEEHASSQTTRGAL